MNLKELTMEQLETGAPELYASICARGAQMERERLSEIDELTPPGYEELAAQAKESGESAYAYHKRVIKAQKDELLTLGLYDNESSGPHLVDSIKLHKKLHAASAGGPSRYVLIYPTGKHGQYNRRLRTKAYKNSKHGRTYTVGGDQKATSSSEVGFIHEYGAPRRNIPAKRWMQNANEKSAAATTAAQAAVYNKFLESKNL